jgi:hypothetical protein
MKDIAERLELRVGIFRRKLLNVRETFRVERDLRSEPRDIRSRLLVIRFQDLGLLPCRGERRLQLRDLVLKRRRVDLEQHRLPSPARSA